jgi:hypothetical protein
MEIQHHHDAHSTGRRLHLVWGFEIFGMSHGELVEETVYWFQPKFIPILGFAKS